MPRNEMIEVEGTVLERFPGMMYNVDIGHGRTVLAHLSGKMKTNFIRVLVGDKVTLELSPYDLTKGRIVWRSK